MEILHLLVVFLREMRNLLYKGGDIMMLVKIILTAIPFIWTIGMVPFVNQVKPLVLGIPFFAFWMIAGIFVCFLCINGLYYIDNKKNRAR